MNKIGIVGADGLNKTWTPEREIGAKEAIMKSILQIETLEKTVALQKYMHSVFSGSGVFETVSSMESLSKACENQIKNTVVISGHCPVGEEMWYCVDCNGWDGTGETPDPHPSEKTQREHRVIKVYDKGGVDTWAEIIATQLGIQIELHPAENLGWNDEIKLEDDGDLQARKILLKGYRSRNIDMANVLDVCFDIEPKGSCKRCGGKGFKRDKFTGKLYDCEFCKRTGNYSGGTWTMRYAEKLGKEVHQIVVE